MNLNQVTVTVSDLPRAIAFYRQLGLRQIVDSPHYARFACPRGDATFSLHAGEVSASGTAVIYFETESEKALIEQVARLQEQGVVFDLPVTRQRWLWTEAQLRDPSGNRLILYWAGENRLNPPWRMAARES